MITELRLGKMTTQEIAEWMGISYSTFRKNSSQRLEYLKNFAVFTKTRGFVDIEEIIIPYYIKNISIEDKYYVDAIRETKNGLATIAGIVRKLKRDKPEFKDIPEETLYKRMAKAGDRAFGKTADSTSKGTHGTRHYIWAIKVDDYNYYRFMTEEEETVYKKIRDKYCKDKAEIIEKEALLKDAYKKKEISAQEYADKSLEMDFFNCVLVEFLAETGLKLVRTTEHELYESQLRFMEMLAKGIY